MNPFSKFIESHKLYLAALPTLALFMMLACILLPVLNSSLHLEDPTPSQLLITICVSLFASVIYLWILDATGILPFKSPWVSKSVYGAAIVSILGTSVGVYKDYFQNDKYPLRGRWDITILNTHGQKIIAENQVNLSFSENSQSYYGFSNINEFALRDTSKSVITVEIQNLSIDKKTVNLVCFSNKGNKMLFNTNIKMIYRANTIVFNLDSNITLNMLRPNY